ncbi:DUF429 domain-containing protein [Candidatus Bipolaricaulota bacterium]|nr:DUF429 domain-containing protein [Candidatus Bipolaricaulota bacterium]
MRFIGLDLAWSRRRTTGGAILAWDGNAARLVAWDPALGDDGSILAFTLRGAGEDGALVAIDAPLVVPNERGTRPCDRALSRAYRRQEAAAYPANRARLGPAVRGEVLAARLQDHGFTASPLVHRQGEVRQVVEVYPHPATVELFGLEKTLKYKARPGRTLASRWAELLRLRELLGALADREPALDAEPLLATLDPAGLRGQALKAVEDLLDALVCAYIAVHLWYWGEAGCRRFGDLDTGYVLVPIRPGDH